jgi:hypothetical protein
MSNTSNPKSQEIKELEEKIERLKSQWPAHSLQPWMLQQLEELEDQLIELMKNTTDNDE